jgi:hypothetical protein
MPGRRRGVPADHVPQDVDQVAADQDEGAEGEVDHLGGLVDHHEAQRQQRVDRAFAQAVDHELDERLH